MDRGQRLARGKIDDGDRIAILVRDESLGRMRGARDNGEQQTGRNNAVQWPDSKRAFNASRAGWQNAVTAFIAAASFKFAGGSLLG